jgi:hypothetical protein
MVGGQQGLLCVGTHSLSGPRAWPPGGSRFAFFPVNMFMLMFYATSAPKHTKHIRGQACIRVSIIMYCFDVVLLHDVNPFCGGRT